MHWYEIEISHHRENIAEKLSNNEPSIKPAKKYFIKHAPLLKDIFERYIWKYFWGLQDVIIKTCVF